MFSVGNQRGSYRVKESICWLLLTLLLRLQIEHYLVSKGSLPLRNGLRSIQLYANKPFLKPRTTASYLLNSSTRMSHRHFTLNLSKLNSKLNVSSSPQSPNLLFLQCALYLNKRTAPQTTHMRKTWESCSYVTLNLTLHTTNETKSFDSIS